MIPTALTPTFPTHPSSETHNKIFSLPQRQKERRERQRQITTQIQITQEETETITDTSYTPQSYNRERLKR